MSTAATAQAALDMPEPWHYDWPDCRKCHRTSSKHMARGLCGTCYQEEHKAGRIKQWKAKSILDPGPQRAVAALTPAAPAAAPYLAQHIAEPAPPRQRPRWSPSYYACRDCGSNTRPHLADGYCVECAMQRHAEDDAPEPVPVPVPVAALDALAVAVAEAEVAPPAPVLAALDDLADAVPTYKSDDFSWSQSPEPGDTMVPEPLPTHAEIADAQLAVLEQAVEDMPPAPSAEDVAAFDSWLARDRSAEYGKVSDPTSQSSLPSLSLWSTEELLREVNDRVNGLLETARDNAADADRYRQITAIVNDR